MDLYLSRGSRLVSSVLLSSEDCSQSEVSIEDADQSQLSIHLLAARHRGVVRHRAHGPRHVPSAGLLAPLAPGPHLCVDIFRFMVDNYRYSKLRYVANIRLTVSASPSEKGPYLISSSSADQRGSCGTGGGQ